MDAALDLSYEVTKKYTPSYLMKEIQGIADGSGVHANDMRVMWLGELTRGSCSRAGYVVLSIFLPLSLFTRTHTYTRNATRDSETEICFNSELVRTQKDRFETIMIPWHNTPKIRSSTR